MASASITLRPASEDDLDYVERVLSAADLPTADLGSKVDCFFLAVAGDNPVGVGGIEAFGSVGLLRSVAVESSERGRGYGTAICDELEARAHDRGIDRLYLLTTTAADFFAGRGYRTIDRNEAPGAIRGTTEFTGLCPSSATCMRKRLE